MADTYRYRYGETNPISLAFKSAVAVQVGDLCFEDETDSNTVKPAGSLTWPSAVGTPAAPTVANSAVAVGSPLTNALTGVKISYQFPWGEGALSAAGTATPTTAAQLLVSGAPLVPPTPALYTNVYVETAAGSGTFKLWGTTYGESVMVNSYGAGQVPAASPVTSAALDVAQFNFASRCVGVSTQRYDGSNANAYGIKDGKLRIDTAGVFDFDCASASFNPGDMVGPAKQSGNALEPQKVIAVVQRTLAIGVIDTPYATVTTARVKLFPRKMLPA